MLGLIVAELLWRRFPDEAEGELTRRHTLWCAARPGRGGAGASGSGRASSSRPARTAAGVRDNPERARRCLRGGDRRALSRWRARRRARASSSAGGRRGSRRSARRRAIPRPRCRNGRRRAACRCRPNAPCATEGPAHQPPLHRRRCSVEGLPPRDRDRAPRSARPRRAAAAVGARRRSTPAA